MGILGSSIKLGCAVTDEAVTVVACTHHTHHVQVHKYAEVRLKRLGAGEHTDIDGERVETALRKIVSALKIKHCECAISIPVVHTTYGFFTPPKKTNLKGARTLLRKDIQGHFTVSKNNVAHTEWRIPAVNKDASSGFGYTALERSALHFWKALGMRVQLRFTHGVVDVPSMLTMLYAQEHAHESAHGQAGQGVIDVGDRSTFFAVSRRGVPIAMRALPWGLRDAYKKNDLSGLKETLSGAYERFVAEHPVMPRDITWYVCAPNALLSVFQTFLKNYMRYTVSPLKMLFDIPPRVSATAYSKAITAAGYPRSSSFTI